VLDVRVVPNAAKSTIAGERDGALLIRLAAPPVDGKANDALASFLADLLGVPVRAISIVRGHAARRKQVLIAGLGRDDLLARLGAAR
jgi:uncharacterized protein (TIGR00251 family)